MPVLTVRHVTTYRYRQPVAFGEHRMMFRPREGHDQRILDVQLNIEPRPVSIRWLHDVFGNSVTLARFTGRAKELRFESIVRLDHRPLHALDFQIEDHAESYPFAYSVEDLPDLSRSIERQYPDPERDLERWARQFLRKDGATGTLELLSNMTHAIRRGFTYIGRTEKGIQAPTRTLKLGSGTCRDFAVLMIEAVRCLGLAARFVSGYIYVPSREGRSHVGGGSTHAWLRVYARRRLGRVRPHQRHRRQSRPDPSRRGPRPAPCGAARRQLDRLSLRLPRHDGGGGRHLGGE